MPQPVARSRVGRNAGMLGIGAVLVWAACAFWNFVKPLPAGTHVTSLPARLTESQVDFIDGRKAPGALLKRQLEIIGRADQTIALDQCPLSAQIAAQLLSRKRQRPNIKILLVTDPRNEVYGGTPATILSALERAGIVVARTRLGRLRDSNPLYSSWWRLAVGWWSDPFDEVPGAGPAALRWHNLKANERQLLVADDGAGGWTSVIMSGPTTGGAPGLGLEIRGRLAHDIVGSELRIAAWSTDDDRLPTAPPVEERGVGSIDARFLTEGAIATALGDAIAVAGAGDSLRIAGAFDERHMVDAVAHAAARGTRVQLLLDPGLPETQAAAAELEGMAGRIEVRWRAAAAAAARYAVIQQGNDVWITAGSAGLTRRGLQDFNLEANVELHLPARAAAAREALDLFTKEWLAAAAYPLHSDESPQTYWRYRLAEATGLSMF